MRKYVIEYLNQALISIIAIIIGFVIGGLILWLTGYNPVFVYEQLFMSAFGDYSAIIDTLTAMTPIIFTGVAAAFIFKSSLFFIGMEGELYIGAIFAFLAGYLLQLPPGIHLLVAFLAGGLGGLLWGLGPGYLRAKYGVNETVTAIMLNWVAIYLSDYIVQYAFPNPYSSIAKTYDVHPTARIPLISSNLPLTWAFPVSIIMALLTGYLLYNTTLGFEIRAVGLNPKAARVAKINIMKAYLFAFIISGFLSGLAGSSMVLGVFGSLVYRFSPGYGWDGITAALIARNNPYMVIPAALLLAMLRTGSIGMMLYAGVSNELVLTIQGVILIAAAAPEAYRLISNLINKWREKHGYI